MAAVGFGLVVPTVVAVVSMARTGDPSWLLLALPFSVGLWMFGRLGPQTYALGDDGVEVHRKAGVLVIPYRTILGCDDEDRVLTGLTLFGSRGIFGHFGRFWSPRLGNFRLYLSNRRAVVWLATVDGWVALSPDRPREFLDRLRRRLPPAAGG